MKYNMKMVVLVSIVTAVISSVLLKAFGEALGIPQDWHVMIVGGLSGGLGSVVGQKYAVSKDENS